MSSFLEKGHAVTLHCYEPPSDIPPGVELFDARKIMPKSELIANRRTGSVSLGSNRYRYRLISAGMGMYADCDMYCIKPIPDEDYIFGWEDGNTINGALLKFPPHSQLARTLLMATQNKYFVPDWLKKGERRALKIKRALGRAVSVEDMSWGVWGPKLITHCVRESGLQGNAKPIDFFYPLHFGQTDLLFQPGLSIEDLITPRTFSIHLWNKMQDKRVVAPDSALARIISSSPDAR